MISYERAKEIVSYDKEKGTLTWAKTRGNRVIKGKPAGHRRKKDGYWVVRLDDKLYLSHRIAWLLTTGSWPSGEIDHISGDPSDMRFVNLRDVGHNQNILSQRTHRDNKLKQKGVSLRNNGRYYVLVKGVSCGGYSTLEDAVAAYDKNARVIMGEFFRK